MIDLYAIPGMKKKAIVALRHLDSRLSNAIIADLLKEGL